MQDNIQILKTNSPLYPPLLREIHQPPKTIYLRGSAQLLQRQPLLAVVGSRKASAYGRQAISQLLTPVVQAQIPLVSGLAYGIDSLAHQLCLDLSVPTIAVLGSGIDDAAIYPRVNTRLAQQIISRGGAVLSEYEPGTPAYASHFPERNRILAGLAKAALVVQAAARSGSLITARLALESNREVLAVPGPINDPSSQGTNHLIQQGAMPALDPQDIFFALDIQPDEKPARAIPSLTKQQSHIMSILTTEPQHIDLVVSKTNLSSQLVSTTLMELELADAVQNVGGMKYVIK